MTQPIHPHLSRSQKLALLDLLDEKTRRAEVQRARTDLISFAKRVFPNYHDGAHHRHIAKIFTDVLEGRKKRVIINIAPRMGKSLLTSYLFPAWFIGHKPDAQIIMATHTASLSEDFGRQVRNLVDSAAYREIFPDVALSEDSKGAGSWNTNKHGKYYAVGVGGALAGRGANLLVLDDPHALPLFTEIPTPRGFRTMEELQVGDEVYGPDGHPTRIVDKSAVARDRPLFRVTTSDGEQLLCDGGHLWTYCDEALGMLTAPARELAGRAFRLPPHMGRVDRVCSIEATDLRADVQCLTVERQDGLFLAGRGYVVTHNSEQDMKSGTKTPFEHAWNWYQTGPRQRLMWDAAVVVLMTRWSLVDITAKLLNHQYRNPDADQWEVVEFPAILNENTEEEKSLWPEKWKLEELRKTRATIEPRYWQAQYQQNPTSDTTALIKREYWRLWEADDPPPCVYTMMSVDTAHDTKSRSDYSACTMWGVFFTTIESGKLAGKQTAHLILLDAFRDRMEFPELKEVLFKHWKEWKPDTFIIEKKAAGAPLIQEFRRMGIPVQEYSPSRGKAGTSNDKIARVNAISDIFASGKVWAPDRRWAKEVIEECAAFPAGEHDDYCLVADTRVRMADGREKRIDTVQAGEFVNTPLGPRRVLAAGCTGVGEIWVLRAGGAELAGTGSHPVAASGKWIRIDKLKPMVDAVAWSRPWCSMGASTGGILTDAIRRIGDTLGALVRGCIAMSGLFSMAPSLQITTSTTRTATPPTTVWRTWSACPQKSTARSTPRANGYSASPRSNGRISAVYVPRLLNGMRRMLDASGTASMRLLLWLRRGLLWLSGGSLATSHTSASGADRQGWRQAGSDSSAAVLAKLQNHGTALVSAVWCTHTTQPVFNLTVEDAHCFYANGVLVHNCDSTCQALLRFRQGGFITLDSDEEEEVRTFRSRRARPYY